MNLPDSDKFKKFQVRCAKHGDQEQIAKIHIQAWQETFKNIVPQKYLDDLPNEFKE